jgi:hypothetical protein
MHVVLRINEGHLDQVKGAVSRAVEFVEAHRPQEHRTEGLPPEFSTQCRALIFCCFRQLLAGLLPVRAAEPP